MHPKHLLLSILLAIVTSAHAVDKKDVKEKWHTPFDLYLDPQEAFDMVTTNPQGTLFIDVRNQPEVHYIGMAEQVDANIPYMFDSLEWKSKKDGIHGTFRKKRNPDFEAAVVNALESKSLDKESPVIIICTSGSRAPFAARALHKAGFKKVYTQVEGFEGIKATSGENTGKRLVNGWKNAGLPWNYDLQAKKMYFSFDPQRIEADKKAVMPWNDEIPKKMMGMFGPSGKEAEK
jgi:rhodanese-related sulfurtransferase